MGPGSLASCPHSPGAYNQPRSDFEYDRRTEALRNLVRNPTAPAAAFESTAARFEERRSEAAAAAAPGSYDLPDFSVELERKRRMASRVAVFGSTAKRFESSRPRSAEPEGSAGRTDLSSALQQQPALGGDKGAARKSKSATTIGHFGRFAGGGWHMGKVKGRDLARESAAFASETQRTASNTDTTVPAPGTYDTREKWDSKKCPVSMGRGAERFVRAPDEFERNRGPGSYQLPPSIQPKPSNRRQVMVSGSKRFGPDLDQFAEKPPGPGAYDVEPFFGSMIKPTYNVAIAEQCGAL